MPPTFVDFRNRLLSGMVISPASAMGGMEEQINRPVEDFPPTLYRRPPTVYRQVDDEAYATRLPDVDDDAEFARHLQEQENAAAGAGLSRHPLGWMDAVPSQDTLLARRLQHEENQRAGVDLQPLAPIAEFRQPAPPAPGAEFRRAFGPSQKQEESETQPDDNQIRECKICMAKPVSTRFKPCYHSLCCSSCADRLRAKECPICRKKILGWDHGNFTSTLSKPKPAVPNWPDSMPKRDIKKLEEWVRGRMHNESNLAGARAVLGRRPRVFSREPRERRE